MMSGPDLEAVRAAAAAVRGSFVYSGGVARVEDLRALAGLRQVNLAGVIVGKALYEGRFDVAGGPGRAGRLTAVHYKRVIPCLDVNAGRVVKGVGFVDLRDAGDPVELAARYDAAGADELVLLDITATRTSATPWSSWLAGPPTRCSSRSRSAAASARWPTPRRCSTPGPTRSRSTRPRWPAPS